MSHNIEIIGGVAQMAWSGETPWHGLGERVADNLTPTEMLKAAHLDWKVEKVPVVASYKGAMLDTTKSALVRDRDSKVLDIVGNDWNALQNEDAFKFFNEYIERGGMKMHTAGALDEGRIVWALAEVNDSFEVFNGDKVDSYLLFVNPHKYGKTIEVKFTPVRVVCNNTLTLALNKKAANSYSTNHRAVFNSDEVKTQMGIAHNMMSTYKEAALHLGGKRYTNLTLTEYLKSVFNIDKEKDLTRPAKIVRDIIETQPGAEFAPGSWWNAFNGVTFAADHVFGNSQDTRLQSSWFGANKAKKDVAMQKALEFADAA